MKEKVVLTSSLSKLGSSIFLYFTKRKRLKDYENAFYFTEKTLEIFSFSRHLNFCTFLSPSFFPLLVIAEYKNLSEGNLKVYRAIIDLSKQEFKNISCLMSWELGQLIIYYVRKIFIENYTENMHQKLVTDILLVLVNSSKYNQEAFM